MAACESVDWRRAMYARNFPGVRLYDDLRTLTGARLLGDLGALPDWIVGSPPCKEFSPVNGRAGGIAADDRFLHAVRLVGECEPRWCAFENSDRIRTRGYDSIAAALEGVGYTCWAFVVGAGATGASHRRQRAFIVAADLSRAQGRPARQPRPDCRVGPYTDGAGIRLEPGRGDGPCGAETAIPLLARSRLGPVGQGDLGRHLREYDGLPAGLAERCREAYGDAVLPQLTELVARAILQADAGLFELMAPKLKRRVA
jgi:DNA (cytosine-5)-methyltransferase 1